ASSRVAFGRTVAEQGVTRERIADARCQIDMARLLTLKAAWMMDVAGNKSAKAEIAMIKIVAPQMACQVIAWAMQVFGGRGMGAAPAGAAPSPPVCSPCPGGADVACRSTIWPRASRSANGSADTASTGIVS